MHTAQDDCQCQCQFRNPYHSLTICWPFADHLLTICWLFVDHLLNIRWPFVDHSLTISWPFADHFLTTCWPFFDHSLTIRWPFVDHLLTICWRFADLCSKLGRRSSWSSTCGGTDRGTRYAADDDVGVTFFQGPGKRGAIISRNQQKMTLISSLAS